MLTKPRSPSPKFGSRIAGSSSGFGALEVVSGFGFSSHPVDTSAKAPSMLTPKKMVRSELMANGLPSVRAVGKTFAHQSNRRLRSLVLRPPNRQHALSMDDDHQTHDGRRRCRSHARVELQLRRRHVETTR